MANARCASFRPYEAILMPQKVAQKSRRQHPKVAQPGERHKIKFSRRSLVAISAAIA